MKAFRGARVQLIGITLALGLLLGACSGTGSSSSASDSSTTVTIAQGNDILSLDPADHGNNSTESALVNIYDYLVNKDFTSGRLEIVPGLATSWERTDDTHWVFHLREGVTWHNGDPFTAQDIKFTVERVQGDKSLRSASKFKTIAAVDAPDDHTVVVTTGSPDSLLLTRFVGNGAGIIPKKAFESAADKEEFFANPIGTGPYRFEKWVKADRLILAKNENWWGGDPIWDRVVIRAIPETTSRVAELLTGGVDVAVNIPPEDIARVDSNEGTRTTSFDIARNLALHVRTGNGWVTADPRVREAIDLAIDREAIVKQVVEGYGSPTRGLFPSAIPGHDPALSTDLTYDPERARSLLAEAGVANGAPIKLSTPSGRYVKDKEISEAVAGYLEEIGFRVDLEVLDWTIYNDKVENDTFGELYLWGMGSYVDGSSLFDSDFTKHYEWSDAGFDATAKAARAATSDEDRIRAVQAGQQIVTSQRARIGLLYPQSIYGVSDRVSFDGRFDEMIFAEGIRPQ